LPLVTAVEVVVVVMKWVNRPFDLFLNPKRLRINAHSCGPHGS
jgi:hypothetical protein